MKTFFVLFMFCLNIPFAFANDDLQVWDAGATSTYSGGAIHVTETWKMNCTKSFIGWTCPSKERTLKGLALDLARTSAVIKCGGTDYNRKTKDLVNVTSGSFCGVENQSDKSKTVACTGYYIGECSLKN